MSTIGELNNVLGGRLCCHDTTTTLPTLPLGKVQSDSRKIEPGDVYWALRGPNHEGEQFVGEAFRRGASGAVVAKQIAPNEQCWTLQVEDTHQALVQWARWRRRQFTGAVIGVTGSAGKTTTRQMIHTVLRSTSKTPEAPGPK